MVYIAAIIIALAFSFIFSGSEMGIYSINRLRLRSREAIGWPGADSLLSLVRNPQRSINTILVGNNVAHYIATVCCTTFLLTLGITRRADYYSTMILAPFLVVFTEITPKMIFLKRADVIMYRVALFLKMVQFILLPAIWALDLLHVLLSKITRTELSGLKYHFTSDKLRSFLTHSAEAGLVSVYQHRMVNNVMRVKKNDLSKAFIPLNNVVMVPADLGREGILEIMKKTDYSRIPVFSGGQQQIIGILNLIDLLDLDESTALSDIIRRPVLINIDESIAHGLYLLQRSNQQMAVVVNHQQEAVGICTIKDLVEEIVGEIYDW